MDHACTAGRGRASHDCCARQGSCAVAAALLTAPTTAWATGQVQKWCAPSARATPLQRQGAVVSCRACGRWWTSRQKGSVRALPKSMRHSHLTTARSLSAGNGVVLTGGSRFRKRKGPKASLPRCRASGAVSRGPVTECDLAEPPAQLVPTGCACAAAPALVQDWH